MERAMWLLIAALGLACSAAGADTGRVPMMDLGLAVATFAVCMAAIGGD